MSEIRVDTISEKTSANGVAIDGLTIKDGGITATTGTIVFNEASADVDFRVESNGTANMLFVNGGTNKVGIGTNAPAELLEVEGTGAAIQIDSNGDSALRFATGGTVKHSIFSSSGVLNFFDNTNSATRMSIDATGAVTMPLQPAFLTEIAQQDDIATSTNVILLFNNEIFDTNADFDTSNYRFTAPVTGKYQFNVSVRLNILDTAADYYQIRLSTSNRTITIDTIDPGGFSGDINFYQAAASVVTDMDANDTAHVIIRQQAGTQQTDIESSFDGTFFSGHLVG